MINENVSAEQFQTDDQGTVVLVKGGKLMINTQKSRRGIKMLAPYLTKPFRVEEGASVLDLLKSLSEFDDEIKLQFWYHIGVCSVKELLVEASLPEEDDVDLKYTKLSWSTDVYDDMVFSDYIDFSGMGPDPDDNNNSKDADGNCHFGLSLSNINRYSRLPLKIDYTYKLDSYKKVNGKYKKKRIFSMFREMTVADAVGGFLDDITFHGSSSSRKEFNDKLTNIVTHITEHGIVIDEPAP